MRPVPAPFLASVCLVLAGLPVAAQALEVRPAIISKEERQRLEQERILAGVKPHWADLRSLVEASQDEGKVRAFLTTHARLADKYSSPSFFVDQIRKWTGRLLPLPEDPRKADPRQIELDFLGSGERETVVLTFRAAGGEEFVRLNGVYVGGELCSVNISKGFATPMYLRKNNPWEYDSSRGRRY